MSCSTIDTPPCLTHAASETKVVNNGERKSVNVELRSRMTVKVWERLTVTLEGTRDIDASTPRPDVIGRSEDTSYLGHELSRLSPPAPLISTHYGAFLAHFRDSNEGISLYSSNVFDTGSLHPALMASHCGFRDYEAR